MIKIQDLAKIVAERHNKSEEEVTTFLDALVDVLLDGLHQEKVVKIKGLGTFKVTTVKERASINVNSGEPVVIEGHDKISFLPDTSMRDLVNKPFSQFETVPVNDGVEFEDIETSVDVEDTQDAEETGEAIIDVETHEAPQAVALAGLPENEPAAQPESENENEVPVAENETDDVDITTEEAVTETENVTETESVTETVTEEADSQEEALDETRQEEREPLPQVTEEEQTENELDTEENEEDMKKISWTKLLLSALLIAAAAFALGYAVGQKAGTSTSTEIPKAKTVVEETPDSLKEGQTTTNQTEAKEETQKAKVSDDMSQVTSEELERANEKVAYGAYRIVGVERVVTARAGQTLKAISDANLGPGAEAYVKALNDGVSTVSEGQKIRIPKVELKKKSAK
ncbi:MAG: HU family DNA-binding protein [Prevotella sp.]|nr:HU family DNA-binding protein [Prevotella sp.]